MRGETVPILQKIGPGDHEGIPASTEVGGVAKFLGEEVAGVNYARYVFDGDDSGLMGLAHAIFVEVDVLGALECYRGCPVDGCFVVVVDGDGFGCVGEAEVEGAVAN